MKIVMGRAISSHYGKNEKDSQQCGLLKANFEPVFDERFPDWLRGRAWDKHNFYLKF